MAVQFIPILLSGLRMAMTQLLILLPTLIAAIVTKMVNTASRMFGLS